MEIHQLRYFVAVVETGGFGKAAQRCNVAQPSLSQQIIKLEKELEVKLFDRLGRTVAVTTAGRSLLPHALSVLQGVDAIEQLREDEADMSVGFITTLAPFLLAATFEELGVAFPRAKVTAVEGMTEHLIEELVAARLDLAMMSLPLDPKQLDWVEIAEEPLLVALQADHPLVERAELTINDLDDQPFVALDEAHCLGRQVSDYCYGHHLYPNIVCRVQQLTTALRCVRNRVGISLVPSMAQQSEATSGLVFRSLGEEGPRRPIVAAWHRRRQKPLVLESCIEVVKRVVYSR